MRRSTLFFLLAAAAVIVLAGCQTAKPVSAEQSMIRADASGFAPGAGAGHDTIAFTMSFGNSDAVKTWSLSVMGTGGAVKTFTGDGKNLPATLSWDGKNDAGSLVDQGILIDADLIGAQCAAALQHQCDAVVAVGDRRDVVFVRLCARRPQFIHRAGSSSRERL